MTKTFNDAGLLRAYLADNYGQYYAFGGSAKAYFKAIRKARILAKLVGKSLDEVVAQLRDDYLAAE